MSKSGCSAELFELIHRHHPEVKLSQTLGRIWDEYPRGMLDISEDELANKEPDAPAVETAETHNEVEEAKEPGIMMTFEEMRLLRDTITGQLK